MKKYLIENIGCDDSTEGVFEFTGEQADFLNSVFTKLNANSYYGCMPTIYIKSVESEPAEGEQNDKRPENESHVR